MPGRVVILRTSDRSTFRRCRRRWKWSSMLREGRESTGTFLPLWIGSGFHYALEDHYGLRQFSSPADAFRGFLSAYRKTPNLELPEDWEEGTELACGMLKYYVDDWLSSRFDFPTHVVDGLPQVEITFRIEVPYDGSKYGIDTVYYEGTFDRVGVDEYGGLWIFEYKTAKAYEERHLLIDQQTSSYCWAGEVIYDRPIEGVVYQQHKKTIPQGPRILANGKISSAQNMVSSQRLYKKALVDLSGVVEKSPAANVRRLNDFAEIETEHRDAYVIRDLISRNSHQIAAEGEKILMECEDILNPNLPMYPNPTRDCHWCPFMGPCISLDDGSDWEGDLEELTQKRAEDYNPWRPYLPMQRPS